MTTLHHGPLIKETTVTSGTGDFTVAGAVAGNNPISSEVPDGGKFIYKILDADLSGYEIGIGTLVTAVSGVVTRDEILYSSNSGNAVNLSAGTHTVLLSATAGYSTGDIDHGNNIFEKAELKNFYETLHAPVIAAGVLTLDLDEGNTFDVALDANVTSLVISRTGGVKPLTALTLWLTQDGTGSRTFVPGAAYNQLGADDISVESGANEQTAYSLITRDSGVSWVIFKAASGALTAY